jgi:hypothetical protein
MPRNESLKVYNTFVGGLVTESTPLTFPENSSLDSLNVTYDKKGDVKRRLGLDYEASSTNTSLSIAETKWDTQAVGVFEWKQVGGDGDLHFLVIQVDATLYYYDISSTPVSGNKKTFTTDLATFAAPAASDVGSERIDIAFGKGYFFVVSKKLKPFYVTYDPDGDSITNTEIGLLIRDFDGVEDSLDIDEEPSTLSDTHNYNLTNQGWVSPGGSVASPITTYFSSQSKYPGNNKQWFVAKNSSDDFDPAELTKIFFGNTLAPRGHWILDPFNQDRSTVSGISNITSVTSDNRPESVAFFAGRAWYGGPSEEVISGHLYFSQIIEDPAKIGRCYQEADPTSEEISDLVDTDGGVIVIPEAGSIVALHVTGSSLLVFAHNGLWEVTGSSGSGFTPTDYSVSKVSSVGLIGSRTLVDVEGTPIWWSDRGIYSVGRNEITDRIEAQSLTEKTIQTFYDEDIENISKLYCQGSYDSVTKRVTWLYNSVGNETSYRFKFDKALVFDTVTGSFSPYDHGSLASNSPYTSGVFTLPSIGRVTDTETVIQASSGATVIRDSDSETVVADVAVLRGSSTTTMLWTIVPGSSLSEWTFSQYSDADFFDWTTANGTGINFDSYFETGYLLEGNVTNYRKAPWVWVFSKRTETGYISDGAGGYNVENPSSCYLQPRWDFADHSNSSKFGRRQQIYRILKDYDKTPTSLDFNSGFPVTTTKNKVRGKGRALTLRFESESGKDFDIYGWAVQFSDNAAG